MHIRSCNVLVLKERVQSGLITPFGEGVGGMAAPKRKPPHSSFAMCAGCVRVPFPSVPSIKRDKNLQYTDYLQPVVVHIMCPTYYYSHVHRKRSIVKHACSVEERDTLRDVVKQRSVERPHRLCVLRYA